MSPRYTRSALALLLSTLSLTGMARAADPVKVELVQSHPSIGVGEEVFLYAIPKQLGYFKEENLDVTINGVAGSGAAAQVLASGGAQFATTMPETNLQMREKGGDTLAVYNLKRSTGTILIVMADSPIKTLTDLKGKTIGGVTFGSGGGLALKNNLTQLGITADQYSTASVGVGAASFTALQTGKVDALILWDAMRGAAENTGMQIRAIEVPIQNTFAAMALSTTSAYAAANPAVVAGMCRAVAKGLHFAIANPEAAVRIFWKEFPQTKPTTVDEATALKNHMHIMQRWMESALQGITPGKEEGAFQPANWESTREVYTSVGVIKGSVPATDGYTTKFLEQCNGFDRSKIAAQAKDYK
jgi:NitT/TauT family transport system substrate-binding protein